MNNFYQTLWFICLMLGVSCDQFSRVKRSDIDLQTCIDDINVHRDKIIRTQDSQNMGAKYLNEIDLGSREECLRLCCETDNCDVFVFEEKNSGSCYLFYCGPPEDFKCKFTHHVNYSSGVLSVNRHLPDLESQIKLTKHEQDLTKLRKPEVEVRPPAADAKTTMASTTTAMAASKEMLPDNKGKLTEEGRKCSPFQFECRSTGECIAIYNACDGIPQCADASDEAVELGCPDTRDTRTTLLPVPSTRANIQPVPIRFEPNLLPPQQLNPNVQNIYTQPQQPQLQPLIPHQHMDFLRPVNDPRNAVPIRYDNQIQPYGPPIPVQNQGNWYQHQANQMAPQVPQYVDKNSHIFNHKESGLQVQDGQEMSPMQYADNPNNGPAYPKVKGYYADYRQPVQQENWPVDEGTNENQQKYLQDIMQDKNRNKAPDYNSPQQAINSVPEPANSPHVQEKLAHDLKHSKDNMEHGNVQHQKIKIEQHLHHEKYPDVVSYRIVDNDLQDGVSQTPRGAVLSVTLGLIITILMAIMIACRVKMIKRRLRRGGKPYAHEADFLVNGMYL